MQEMLTDGEITLRVLREMPAEPCRGRVRAIEYAICVPDSTEPVGRITLRLGYTLELVRYGGNIGYGVEPEHRGHHYAGKACRIVRQVAVARGMDVLWVTCNAGNWPSRKTCEWIGATLVETVDLPPDNDQYRRGDRQKCRYRWILY